MYLISVIVPVYNTEKYLTRCVTSILSQSYKNIELILVDDGSTDNSGDICENFKKIDSRVKVIHKKNGGQSSARNIGLDTATGNIISFVDSDDWLVQGIYEHCINLFNRFKADVVDFDVVFTFNENEKRVNNKYPKIEVIKDENILYDYLKRGQTEKTPFSVCRKLYVANLFLGIRFPEGKIYEDIATNFKLLMNAKILIHTSYTGYCYRQQGISTTRQGFRIKDFDLIDAANNILIESKRLNNEKINYFANVKLARSYFSLLSKIALYGFNDDNIDKNDTIKHFTKELRKKFSFLIKITNASKQKDNYDTVMY